MERFIEKKFLDELTGLSFGVDRQGRTHLLEFLWEAAEAPLPKESIYLKAFTEKNWAGTATFQTITCTLTGNPTPLIYEIPPNKVLKLDNIIAVVNGRYRGISLIGIYINDIIESFFPIQNEMSYSFNEKVKIEGKLEFKFKPYHRRTKLSIFVHGLLI